MAVLVYQLLKGTGRRVGEVASLHLECLDVDEHGKDVLVYDNHKAGRMGRRLPLADSALVAAVRDQQAWVRERFPTTPAGQLWLLPRPHKNVDGTNHLDTGLINAWMRTWVERVPRIDAGPLDAHGEPVPFDRSGIHPHAFRHTYAQTMADSGVPPSVLRDLMDHRSLSTTLGYYQVGDARKRAAMEVLARHTIDNRGVARPVAVSARDTTSRAALLGGGPDGQVRRADERTRRRSGLPDPLPVCRLPALRVRPLLPPGATRLRRELRKEREAMLAAGAADWAVEHVSRQLEVIVGHIGTHEAILERLTFAERTVIEEASTTLRKARQSVPVAFGRRRSGND